MRRVLCKGIGFSYLCRYKRVTRTGEILNVERLHMRTAIKWNESRKGHLEGLVVLSSTSAIEEEIKNMPIDRPSLKSKEYTQDVQFTIDTGNSKKDQETAAKNVQEFMDFYYPDWKFDSGLYVTDLKPATEQAV